MADTARAAAHYLNNIFFQYKTTPVLFLVSGGSALRILDDVDFSLCTYFTVGLLDERIGPTEVRNWTPRVTMPILQNVTPQVSGRDYDKKLHAWKKDHPDGVIIITQGIGEDGHTAGMMVGFEHLFNGPEWAVGYDAGEKFKFRYRVTVTSTFLKNIVDVSVVYAAGRKKKEAIKNFTFYPNAHLFTDQQIIR